ncbi:ATP-binding protein [Psychromonas sp. 14N.309.X.WAT.B.A12]|uniref:ATP-binding protein n=1 Tax=Psychromonas sp. 14N.309.X.WAT.B.A12 TaxID=2998322 RepID=UPI0025B0B639|nr:ATP-binding protein [Psychromonas sp. 14N.309.X.WAT.B.A12]MDN2662640.1 ATP-binding protein [Psychromonas sp. 14N.309.X.WAT.B.A12]
MHIKAKYKQHIDTNLNDNPLCEAIEIELDKKSLLRKLTVTPKIMPNFWELPMIYQMTQLRQLTEIHIPAPEAAPLYYKIMSLILFSYVHRNPFSKEMRRLADNVASEMRKGHFYESNNDSLTTAPTSLVYGESGTGKTTVIRRVLSHIPQTIQHTSYQGKHFTTRQIVWVSFDLPPNGSPKAMVANFLRAVDTALGNEREESYTYKWVDTNARYSVDKLMAAMQNITVQHAIGLVHIDELQFMLGHNKIKDSPTLQVLETLFNKIGIPLLLSSTRQGVELFDTLKDSNSRLGHDMTTVRRMLNDRQFMLKAYPINHKNFDALFNALFPPGLMIEGIQPSNHTFKQYFHELSCGLPAIMTRLAQQYHETLVNLRQTPKNIERYQLTYDTSLLSNVFKNQFSLIEPALLAFRAGNNTKYEQALQKSANNKKAYSNTEVQHVDGENNKEAAQPPSVLKSHESPQHAIGILIPQMTDKQGGKA